MSPDFKKIFSFKNLLLGYREARRSKRYKDYALKFGWDLEKNLFRLRDELRSGEYSPSDYREFVIYEPKRREIKAPAFRDRVIHHSLFREVEPVFDEGFIYDTYACRKGKGTHRAVKRLKKFLRSARMKYKGKTIYCLKGDVFKYFASIDHGILFKLLLKRIGDGETARLLGRIIKSSEDGFGKGVPIGNLTSQLFANVYLNELDQFVKHRLREKYYIRYMDDFLILGGSKEHLWKIKKEMEEFLESELNLELNPRKVRLFPADKGIDFLGYVVFETHVFLRSPTLKRWRKKFKGLEGGEEQATLIAAWRGYVKHADAWRVDKKLTGRNFVRQPYRFFHDF